MSIKLIHRAYLYLTIGHEGLGSTGSSPRKQKNLKKIFLAYLNLEALMSTAVDILCFH